MNTSEAQKHRQDESKDKKTKKSEKLEKRTEVTIHEKWNLECGVDQKTVQAGTKNQSRTRAALLDMPRGTFHITIGMNGAF